MIDCKFDFFVLDSVQIILRFLQLPNSPKFKCPHCDKEYAVLDSYQSHLRRVHNENQRQRKVKCSEDNCLDDFFSINELRNHMKEKHRYEIIVDVINFSNEAEFNSWKETLEQQTNERFVQSTGGKECIRVGETSRITYNCHCTGFEKKKDYDDLNKGRNSKGSWKMNGHCIAQMILIKKSVGYEVIFYRTHNHRMRPRNCNLSEKTVATVAAMIKARLKDDFILEHFQKQPKSQRDHFLKEKDIREIRYRYGLMKDGREHKDDSKSVHIFANSHSDMVIYYRPKIVGDYGKEEPFMLCIQTDRQRDFLGETSDLFMVCADSTHDIGPKFKLTTLMTVDKNFHGFPLAFCVCKSEDAKSMQIFFAAIREKIGRKLKAEYFVSDDANAFYNAWCAEMCESDEKPHKRLCEWHVNKNWICNLNRIKDPLAKKMKKTTKDSPTNQQVGQSKESAAENDSIVEQCSVVIEEQRTDQFDGIIETLTTDHQVEVESLEKETEENSKDKKKPSKRQVCKNLLFEMRFALTIEKFEEKKKAFEELLASDDDYKSFQNYFKKTYASRYQQWADAYLPKFGPCNTNMYLESWHSKLKHKYLGGRKQRRLDYILDKIVEYDKHQERVAEHEQEFGLTDKRTSLVLKYHKQAIADYKEGKYKISCYQNRDVMQQYVIEEDKEQFFVTMKDDDPNHWKNCAFNCESCKTCFCLFECTCQDYRKRHNPCIHLHVITLDKASGFDKMPESDFETVTENFDWELNDLDDSYPTIEIQQTSENGVDETESISQLPEIPINSETVRNTCGNFIGDVLRAVEQFPHRAKEFDDFVKELNKKFNQIVNCDVEQILSFHLTSPLKRTLIQKQVRRSPKKAKKS